VSSPLLREGGHKSIRYTERALSAPVRHKFNAVSNGLSRYVSARSTTTRRGPASTVSTRSTSISKPRFPGEPTQFSDLMWRLISVGVHDVHDLKQRPIQSEQSSVRTFWHT